MNEPRAALLADLRAHPVPTITVDQYATLAGIAVPTAYQSVARGDVRTVRRGRRILVLTAPLLESLGYSGGGAR